MKDGLSANTEIVSYFLWEYTRHGNALDLWYCAEDIGFFLEASQLFERGQILEIIELPKNDEEYISFIRHIAYRLYAFMGDSDSLKNWFLAEKLFQNKEWLEAVLTLSRIFSEIRGGDLGNASSIRSEKFRKLFGLF